MSAFRRVITGSLVVLLAGAVVYLIVLVQRSQSAADENSKLTAPPGFEAVETPGGIFYRRLDVDRRLEGVSKPAFEKALKIVR